MDQTDKMTRRGLLGGLSLAALLPSSVLAADLYANTVWRTMSDAEWRRRLPRDAYQILRHEDTERPFTSPLLNEHRSGRFVCIGCDLPLFNSTAKYDSGTGWPSFWEAIPGSIGRKPDYALGVLRTEYHCARCLGHHGHVFNDGPRPSGLRYCNNGWALKFVPV